MDWFPSLFEEHWARLSLQLNEFPARIRAQSFPLTALLGLLALAWAYDLWQTKLRRNQERVGVLTCGLEQIYVRKFLEPLSFGKERNVFKERIEGRFYLPGYLSKGDTTVTKVVHYYKSVLDPVIHKEKWQRVCRRYKLLAQIEHHNLVYFYQIRTSRTSEDRITAELLMECCEGGTLSDLIRTCKGTKPCISNRTLFDYAQQITEGLEYLHENKIIHTDLKPANILVKNKINDLCTLLIADLDDAIHMHRSTTCVEDIDGRRGTRHYMAPEMLRKSDETDEEIGRKSDVWSLGCVFLDIADCCFESTEGTRLQNGAGQIFPVTHQTEDQVLKFHIMDGYRPFIRESIDKAFSEIIRNCSNENYKERWSARNVFDGLVKTECEWYSMREIFQYHQEVHQKLLDTLSRKVFKLAFHLYPWMYMLYILPVGLWCLLPTGENDLFHDPVYRQLTNVIWNLFLALMLTLDTDNEGREIRDRLFWTYSLRQWLITAVVHYGFLYLIFQLQDSNLRIIVSPVMFPFYASAIVLWLFLPKWGYGLVAALLCLIFPRPTAEDLEIHENVEFDHFPEESLAERLFHVCIMPLTYVLSRKILLGEFNR